MIGLPLLERVACSNIDGSASNIGMASPVHRAFAQRLGPPLTAGSGSAAQPSPVHRAFAQCLGPPLTAGSGSAAQSQLGSAGFSLFGLSQ